jgi:carbonyl reductase 1
MGTPELPPSPWLTPKYSGEPWWTKDTVVVVTGSNRGIGHGILRELIKSGMTAVLTDKDDTQASIAALKAEGLGDSVISHPLDVGSLSSVATFSAWLKETLGGFDILINNAGVWPRELSFESAKVLHSVNYYGARAVTEALLPLLRPGGRIINVTSRTGFYQRLKNEEVLGQFRDVETLSLETLDSISNKYLNDLKAGELEKEGWIPPHGVAPAYAESKMLLSAYTVVLSKTLRTEDPADQKIFASAYCPGFIDTAMTKNVDMVGLQVAPLEVGIDTGVWLALLPIEEFAKKHGKFFGERLEYPYTWVPWIDPFTLPPPA